MVGLHIWQHRTRRGTVAGFACLLGLYFGYTLASTDLCAQTITGSLHGVISDANGVGVPGASATLTNSSTGAVFPSEGSDAKGRYHFVAVPPGDHYRLVVEVPGFRTAETEDIRIGPAFETRFNVRLEMGSVAERVAVVEVKGFMERPATSEIVVVSDTLPSVQALKGALMPASPINGAVSESSLPLSPGSGTRTETVHVDGLPTLGNAAVGFAQRVPRDAIDRMSTGDPFGAAFSGSPESHIVLLTRLGNNDFHGSLTRSSSHEAFASANPFAVPGDDAFRRDLLAGALGGRIVRDRVHFFAASEGERHRIDSPFLQSSLTRDAVDRAIQSIGGINRVNPLSAAVLGFMKQGDSRFSGVSNEADGRIISSLVKTSVKFDDVHALNVQYLDNRTDNKVAVPLRQPGYRSIVSSNRFVAAGNYDLTLGSRFQNTTQATYMRANDRSEPEDQSFSPVRIGLAVSDDAPNAGMPTIRIAGYDAIGAVASPVSRGPSSNIRFADSLSAVFGGHDIKAGVDIQHGKLHSSQEANGRGWFYFDSLEAFLTGQVGIGRAALGDSRRTLSSMNAAWYAQDTLRFANGLAVTVGVRWDYFGVPTEADNSLTGFLPDTGLIRVGTPELPKVYEPDTDNFAPRVSFSWAPQENGRISITGGYGIYYSRPSDELLIGQRVPNSIVGGPAYAPVGPSPVRSVSRYDFPWQSGVPVFGNEGPISSPYDIAVIAPHIRTPYSHLYSVSLQYWFSEEASISAGYSGLLGRGLLGARDLNQPTPGPSGSVNERRPYAATFPELAVINVIEPRGRSTLDRFQLAAAHSSWFGWNVRSSYTWSKAKDNVSDAIQSRLGSFPQDGENLGAEYSRSTFEVRHSAIATATHSLPSPHSEHFFLRWLLNDWQSTVLFVAQSGSPFTVGTMRNPSGTREYADRPDLVGVPSPNGSDPTRVLDASAFSDDYSGRFGDVGRNAFISPAYSTLDALFVKQGELNERVKLEFRIEAFNLLNRRNYASPEVLLSEGPELFGRSRMTRDVASGDAGGAGSARNVWFGVKLIF